MPLAVKSLITFLKSVHFINLVKFLAQAMPTIIKAIGAAAKLSSTIKTMPDGENGVQMGSQNQYFDGPFRKEVSRKGVIQDFEAYQQLFGESVLSVKRYACSLTGWFPSGLFTPLTLMATGSAARHEFVIVHTNKSVIMLQVTKKSNQPVEPVTDIQIAHVGGDCRLRDAAEKLLVKQHWYSRTLKEVDGEDLLPDFSFGKLDAYVSYLIEIMRYCGAKKYDLLTANCKTLARSIVYFCEKEADMNCIVQSNLGVFTDKPLFVLGALSLDSMLVEKATFWGAYSISSQIKQAIEELENNIRCLRGRGDNDDESLYSIDQPLPLQ